MQNRIFSFHLRSIMQCATLQYHVVIFMFGKVDQFQNELGETLCHLHQLVHFNIMKSSRQTNVCKVTEVTTNFRISCKFRVNRNGLPFIHFESEKKHVAVFHYKEYHDRCRPVCKQMA